MRLTIWTFELEKENKLVEIKTIAADFTDGQSIYPKIRTQLAPLSIGILVNNVGMGVLPGLLTKVHTEDGIPDMINCNLMSTARMTNMVLPSMRKKKRGIIINVSSLLGTGTTPLATLYGSTKVCYLFNNYYINITSFFHFRHSLINSLKMLRLNAVKMVS